ncbi:MAG: host attachment protein [Alphaproteobacteria bacterium]
MFQEAVYPSPLEASPVPGTRTWIVITDGCRAKVFESLGRQSGIGLAFGTDFYFGSQGFGIAPDRRTFDPAALAHVKAPKTPGADCPKRAFAQALVRALDASLGENRFDRLVLVAPPMVLADLSGCLPIGLRQRVAAEVQRDLMHVAPYELPAVLGSALPD